MLAIEDSGNFSSKGMKVENSLAYKKDYEKMLG